MTGEPEKKLPARFYRDGSGTEPVRDWLQARKKEDRLVIGSDIATVEYGWPVWMPTSKPLGPTGGGAMTNPHIGSSFDSFLEEADIREDVETLAQKRVFAWQIEQAMDEEGISKSEMARRMDTSRTQVNRLLDPDNNTVQLDTLQRAAKVVGRALKLELV